MKQLKKSLVLGDCELGLTGVETSFFSYMSIASIAKNKDHVSCFSILGEGGGD